MLRLNALALCTGLSLLAGCAGIPRYPGNFTATNPGRADVPATDAQAAARQEPSEEGLRYVSQPGSESGASPVAHVTEIPLDKGATTMPGHPLTSVVVTQCNLIVAVYMTMPDGRLLRFDKTASIPSEQLMGMAHSATRSERVEVSCNDVGVEGYEKHDPV